MIGLLLTLAFGKAPEPAPYSPAPLRPPPALHAKVEDQCPQAFALSPGKPVPPELIEIVQTDDGLVAVARCAAVAVPTSEAADALDTATWAQETYDQARLDRTWYRSEIAWRDDYIVKLTAPPPWFERPGVQRTAGRAEVLLGVGLAILAIHAANEVGSGL